MDEFKRKPFPFLVYVTIQEVSCLDHPKSEEPQLTRHVLYLAEIQRGRITLDSISLGSTLLDAETGENHYLGRDFYDDAVRSINDLLWQQQEQGYQVIVDTCHAPSLDARLLLVPSSTSIH